MSHPSLRPLGFGEILDGAFALYRRNFSNLFLTAVIPFIPLAILWAAVGMLLPNTEEGVAAIETLQFVVVPYSLLATVLVWGALVYQAARAYHGETVSWRESYAAAWRRMLPLLGASVLVAVLMMVGFIFLVIPGILVAIMSFAVYPAAMLEGAGPVEAFQRSRALARGAWGRVFAVMVVLVAIVSIPTFAIGVLGAIGAGMAAGSSFTAEAGPVFAIIQVLSTLLSALTTPLLAVGILLLYYDRRVRAEGLDLEMATERLATAG